MAKAKSFTEKIKITGYDELFGGSSGGRCDAGIQEIPLIDLHTFRNHPFKVKDDEAMEKLVESIKENGILVPAMARPLKEGGYEIISGHRRKHAAKLAGFSSMPVIVRKIDDDEAVISMVDANLQRERILPSEKAFSYKMKLEALKHQGKRNDLSVRETSVPGERKLEARDIVAMDSGESAALVRRYIRLTELQQELLDKVDANELGLKQGVEISYLKKNEQKSFLAVVNELSAKPSVEQAARIRNLSRDGRCTKESIYAVLKEEKAKPRSFVIKQERLLDYFPENVSDDVIEKTIFQLLDQRKEKAGD